MLAYAASTTFQEVLAGNSLFHSLLRTQIQPRKRVCKLQATIPASNHVASVGISPHNQMGAMGAIHCQSATHLLTDALNEERGLPIPDIASHPEPGLIAVDSVALVNGLRHGSTPGLFALPEIGTTNQAEPAVTGSENLTNP